MSGRRRYVPDWPHDLTARRGRLGRLLLVAAAGFAVAVFATTRSAGIPASPSPTHTPAALVSSATPQATGTVSAAALEHHSDGWYLVQPEAWPLVAVDRIIDGDTLDVRVSGIVLRVRVFGIDTPERGERCFTEASARLAALAGHEVRLVPDRRQEDQYGRELRYVFTPDGRSIDATLLDEGFAHAWREDGALRPTLVPIEEAAQAAHRGCLWSS